MPQSILIQVGQCGNQIGSQFWNLALQEHAKNNTDGVYDESQSSFFRHVDPKNGMENIPILNSQNPTFNSKIVHLKARGLMIDMEENVINQILSSPLNHLFDHRQIIKSNSGSGNNWAQGYHQYGNEFNDSILNTLQKELEFCDSLQSFILLQSLGGGTGSGLGSYITELIRNEFPNVYSFNTGIIPSINDDVVTSPYNSILSLWKISNSTDCLLPIDNNSLISIYEKITKSSKDIRKSATSLIDNGDNQRKIYNQSQKNEAFKTMNNIVANLLLNMTSSMRFEGSMNVDINDIVTNLNPFPKLNMLTSSMTPFYVQNDLQMTSKVIDQLFVDVFSPESQLLSINVKQSTFLASALIARGAIHVSDLRRNIEKIRKQLRFVPWNPDGWKTGLCDVPPLGQSHSVLSLSNNTACWRIVQYLMTRFNKLYKRKAHLHHYTEYMDKSEFDEAKSSVQNMIQGYQDIESQTVT
ncbi:Tubulin/FtsZ family, GTPase domain-containing protein [Globomyces pollinis-pini]|nr:Tubulin/FtsZ family, GTPase domain-containing protein [Globomyces pollinis-pini]